MDQDVSEMVLPQIDNIIKNMSNFRIAKPPEEVDVSNEESLKHSIR